MSRKPLAQDSKVLQTEQIIYPFCFTQIMKQIQTMKFLQNNLKNESQIFDQMNLKKIIQKNKDQKPQNDFVKNLANQEQKSSFEKIFNYLCEILYFFLVYIGLTCQNKFNCYIEKYSFKCKTNKINSSKLSFHQYNLSFTKLYTLFIFFLILQISSQQCTLTHTKQIMQASYGSISDIHIYADQKQFIVSTTQGYTYAINNHSPSYTSNLSVVTNSGTNPAHCNISPDKSAIICYNKQNQQIFQPTTNNYQTGYTFAPGNYYYYASAVDNARKLVILGGKTTGKNALEIWSSSDTYTFSVKQSLDGDLNCDSLNNILFISVSNDFSIFAAQTITSTCLYKYGTTQYDFFQKISVPTNNQFTTLILSTDGTRLILGTNNNDALNNPVLVYDLVSGTFTLTQKLSISNQIIGSALSNDKTILVLSISGSNPQIWSGYPQYTLLQTLSGILQNQDTPGGGIDLGTNLDLIIAGGTSAGIYGWTCNICPQGKFAASTTLCSNCDAICFTCSGSASTCTSCGIGYYLNANSCTACDLSCTACTSSTVCTSCSNGYYLNVNSCTACDLSCTACTSSTVCSTCANGYYLNANSCTACDLSCAACTSSTVCTSCVLGYYLNVNSCTACDLSCTACTSSTVCTSCVLGYYYANNQCLQCATGCKDCIDGNTCNLCTNSNYYLNSNICTLCASPCLTCSSANVCISCLNDYTLNGSTCNSNSLPGQNNSSPPNTNLSDTYPIDRIIKVLISISLIGQCFLFALGQKHSTIYFLQIVSFLSFTINHSIDSSRAFLYNLRWSYLDFGSNNFKNFIPNSFYQNSEGYFNILNIDANIFRNVGIPMILLIATIILSLTVVILHKFISQEEQKSSTSRKILYRLCECGIKLPMFPLIFFSLATIIFDIKFGRVKQSDTTFYQISFIVSIIIIIVYTILSGIVMIINQSLYSKLSFLLDYVFSLLGSILLIYTINSDNILSIVGIIAVKGALQIFIKVYVKKFMRKDFLKILIIIVQISTIFVIKYYSRNQTAMIVLLILGTVFEFLLLCFRRREKKQESKVEMIRVSSVDLASLDSITKIR